MTMSGAREKGNGNGKRGKGGRVLKKERRRGRRGKGGVG